MKRPIAAISAIALATLALAGCASQPEAPADPEKLVLAMTPSDEPAALQAAGDVIAAALSEELGIPVEATVPTDYAAVITALGAGQADIAFTAPALTVQALDSDAGTPILQVTREGSRSYVSQWFTSDPATYCLTDVVEKEGYKFCNGVDTAVYGDEVGYDALKKLTPDTAISFVGEGSSSGYKFPVAQLMQLGVISAPEDLTNAIFAGDQHPQSVLNVARGEAVVGVSYDDARVNAIEEDPKVADLVVFAWSTPIPNDGVVVASDLSDDLKDRIAAALKKIASEPDVATALFDAYEVDGFDDADLDALDVVRTVGETFK